MPTTNCYNKRLSRCHTPLIEICDRVSQIKLDLGSCDLCAAQATALLLRKAGCVEYETVCEEVPSEVCCGVVDNRPHSRIIKRTVAKPKPSVSYPLHEIDSQGLSVFVLDDKLKTLGYGRYQAVLMLDGCETDIVFDVDYVCGYANLGAITLSHLQPNLGAC